MSAPAMVLVHGWGQSAMAWHAQVGFFSPDFAVSAVNLPGHGGAADVPSAGWKDALLAGLPEARVVLVGWSLGGMLAMELAARHPERVAGLVLIGSTPCFAGREGWRHGCDEALLEGFREALERNAPRLLNRFFALMLHGDKLSRRELHDIARHAVDMRNPTSIAGLRAGLDLLDTLDLRDQLTAIDVPTLVVHGEHDAITPVGAGRYLAEHIAGAGLAVLPGGHAPHWARIKEFHSIVEEWCLNNISIRGR